MTVSVYFGYLRIWNTVNSKTSNIFKQIDIAMFKEFTLAHFPQGLRRLKPMPCFYLENTYSSVFILDSVFVPISGVSNRSLASWPHWNELCFDETIYRVCSWQITCGTWILKGKVFKNLLLLAKMLGRPLTYYISLKALSHQSTSKCLWQPGFAWTNWFCKILWYLKFITEGGGW